MVAYGYKNSCCLTLITQPRRRRLLNIPSPRSAILEEYTRKAPQRYEIESTVHVMHCGLIDRIYCSRDALWSCTCISFRLKYEV